MLNQNALPFSSEEELTSGMSERVATFWETRQQGRIVGRYGLRLQWCAFCKPEHTKAIVVVNGRSEAIVKYQEVFFDLFYQGYDIYSYDHRGQGHSERLVIGSDIGHVVDFDDYVDDLETFVNEIVIRKTHQKRMILANSMGGAIALLYAARKPTAIDSLALSAPMLGINMSPFMKKIAKPLCYFLSRFQHPAGFAPNQLPYKEKPFENNPLTQSELRFQWINTLYEEDERLKLGGPSAQWIWQSMAACERVMELAKKIEMPILLLQAARDQVVSNNKMFDFFHERQTEKLPIQFEILENAFHELLFEKDDIRNKTLDFALHFFDAPQ